MDNLQSENIVFETRHYIFLKMYKYTHYMPCIVHNVIKILINPTFYFCRNNTKWKGMLKLLSRMFQIWLAPPAKTRFVYKLFISCIGLQNTVVVPMHALFNNSLQEPSIWVTPNCWWDLSWEASQFLAPFWNWGLIMTQYKLTLSRCLPLPLPPPSPISASLITTEGFFYMKSLQH